LGLASGFRKYFGGVFELLLLLQRNGKKTRQTERSLEIEREMRQDFFPQLFWQKVFDMDFPQQVLCAGA
jgi:hypothetical protein